VDGRIHWSAVVATQVFGGEALGGEKLGSARQFGAQGVGLPLEAVGVVVPALNEGSLATLFEFHDLELETDRMVFQTGIHHS
jgi:hypothetical protein